MSRRELETARATLKSFGVLEETLRGQPAKRHYRLLLPQLGRLLAVRLAPQLAGADPTELWADESMVRELLGRALPYHRVLAYATGSVNAALLLTRVIFLHRRHLHAQGWFLFSRSDIEQALGLSRWELDTARKCLRGRSLVEERLAYLPTRLYARAVPPAILAALRRIEFLETGETNPLTSAWKTADQIGANSADRPAQKRHPDWLDSRQSGCAKANPQLGGEPAPSVAESLPSKNGVTTGVDLTTTAAIAEQALPSATDTNAVVVPGRRRGAGHRMDAARSRLTVRHDVSEPPPPPAFDPAGAPDDCSWLAFPEDFLPDERKASAAELAGLPAERAQLVLDEVAGRSRKQRSVHTRVGLVRSLVQAERQGRFRPAYAWEVRDARQRAACRQADRNTHQGHELRIPDDIASSFAGKTGYEAFKEFAARWRRGPMAGVRDQTNKEDLT